MLNEFKNHIDTHFTKLKEGKFLLACSGGLDSVVLAYLCKQYELDFALAHCNFKLRGNDSDTDALFVEKLAEAYKKKIHLIDFDTTDYVLKNKVSVQMAARDLRYTWFKQIVQEHGYTQIVTAHHADDDLETFLINLSRGTGINGLTGILAQQNGISRPLLPFSRASILVFAGTQELQWREDQSNTDIKYLRNKIRHTIIPQLKELHPSFLDNFKQTQLYLQQTAAVSKNHSIVLKEQLFKQDGLSIKISIKSLLELSPILAYLYAFFSPYGFTAWDDIHNLLSAPSGKEVFSHSHRLVKDRKHLLLRERTIEEVTSYQINEKESHIRLPVSIKIEKTPFLDETGNHILYIDGNTIKYPLIVRKWKKGDYFHPFGMQGIKKLSKYFKDEKIDVLSKADQWLLCSEDAIVWIIGRRADRRFSVTPETKSIVKFTIQQ